MLGSAAVSWLLWLHLQLVLKLNIFSLFVEICEELRHSQAKTYYEAGTQSKNRTECCQIACHRLVVKSTLKRTEDNLIQLFNCKIYQLQMHWLSKTIQPCLSVCSSTTLLKGLRFFSPPVEMRSFRHTLGDDQYSCLSCSTATVTWN